MISWLQISEIKNENIEVETPCARGHSDHKGPPITFLAGKNYIPPLASCDRAVDQTRDMLATPVNFVTTACFMALGKLRNTNHILSMSHCYCVQWSAFPCLRENWRKLTILKIYFGIIKPKSIVQIPKSWRVLIKSIKQYWDASTYWLGWQALWWEHSHMSVLSDERKHKLQFLA